MLVPAGTVLELRIAEELDFLGRRIEAVRGILLSEESLLRRHLNIIAELKEIRAELSELGRLVGTSERLVAASDCIVPTLRLRLLRDVIFPAEGPGEAGEDSAGELQAIDEDADGNPVLRPLRAKLRREI